MYVGIAAAVVFLVLLALVAKQAAPGSAVRGDLRLLIASAAVVLVLLLVYAQSGPGSQECTPGDGCSATAP